MAKNFVLGNWKMNLNQSQAQDLLNQINQQASSIQTEVQLGVAIPSVYIQSAANDLYASNVWVGSQNVYHEIKGAYTGEVSAEMVRSVGANFTLVGHSERRQYFNEDNEQLKNKVDLALETGLKVVFCCGEVLEERKSGSYLNIIESQLKQTLWHLGNKPFRNVIIAYEPVWAIGTGETASPEQAQEVHAHIRSLLANHLGAESAALIPIIYGGSCKPDNSKELFSMQDINGGLIGGASLDAKDFITIANSFE